MNDPFKLRTTEDYFIRKIEGLEKRLRDSRARVKELEDAIDAHRQVYSQSTSTELPAHGWDRDLWAVLRKGEDQ